MPALTARHQVFGYFSGDAVFDGRRRLVINDLPGLAEEVNNRWQVASAGRRSGDQAAAPFSLGLIERRISARHDLIQ